MPSQFLLIIAVVIKRRGGHLLDVARFVLYKLKVNFTVRTGIFSPASEFCSWEQLHWCELQFAQFKTQLLVLK